MKGPEFLLKQFFPRIAMFIGYVTYNRTVSYIAGYESATIDIEQPFYAQNGELQLSAFEVWLRKKIWTEKRTSPGCITWEDIVLIDANIDRKDLKDDLDYCEANEKAIAHLKNLLTEFYESGLNDKRIISARKFLESCTYPRWGKQSTTTSISEKVISALSRIFKVVPDAPMPQIAAGPDHMVGINWKTPIEELSIEFFEDNNVETFHENLTNGETSFRIFNNADQIFLKTNQTYFIDKLVKLSEGQTKK